MRDNYGRRRTDMSPKELLQEAVNRMPDNDGWDEARNGLAVLVMVLFLIALALSFFLGYLVRASLFC